MNLTIILKIQEFTMKNKPTVLITGGAGYIGSVLTEELLKKNYRVVIIDNLMYEQSTLLNHCHDENFDFVSGDCRDEELIKKYVAQADILIPLACLTGAPLCQQEPWAARSVIVEGVKLILKYRKKEQQIIYPNTNSGYGIGEKGTFCTEESPLNPISLYGKLKVEAEKLIMESGNYVVFRLATVFGASPRMRVDLLVNDFVYRAVKDKFVVLFEADAKRNYIHIRDVVGAFIYSLENWDKLKNDVYNLGLSSANLSKRELCQKIQEIISGFYFTAAEIGEDPDKRDYIVSNDKIEKAGYVPKFTLEFGINELLKVYKIMRLKKMQNLNFQ